MTKKAILKRANLPQPGDKFLHIDGRAMEVSDVGGDTILVVMVGTTHSRNIPKDQWEKYTENTLFNKLRKKGDVTFIPSKCL